MNELFIFSLSPLVRSLRKQIPSFGPKSEVQRKSATFLCGEIGQLISSPTTAILRQDPDPLLGVIGKFDRADRARLERLQWQLENIAPLLKYIPYDRAEQYAEKLAKKITLHFDIEEVKNFYYYAIPRGGFFVLGMLSYLLGVRKEPIDNNIDDKRSVVVVDDCVFSGKHLAEIIRRIPDQPIAIAVLFSHPDVRRMIKDRFPQVKAFLSAEDLEDHAPVIYKDKYQEWKKTWQSRSTAAVEWIGHTDYVCFPWSEPDVEIWNPVIHQSQPGWRLIPPELCLKNRLSADGEDVHLYVQPASTGPIHPADEVLFADVDDHIIVGNRYTGNCFSLEDMAAEMWRLIITQGSADKVVECLIQNYDISAKQLISDVHEFIEHLKQNKLLETDPNA